MAHEALVKAYLDTMAFDQEKSTLSLGGTPVSFHCDKFNTRILKNIEDVMGYEDGSRLLKKWAAQTTYEALTRFLVEGPGAAHFSGLDPKARLEAIFELFKVLAYGAVKIVSVDEKKAVFSSATSYLAEGWLENKKNWGWETRHGPACHDLAGHLVAAMALAYGKPFTAYAARETSCRTEGHPECVFEVEGV